MLQSVHTFLHHTKLILSAQGHPELAAHILHKLSKKMTLPQEMSTFWVHFSATLSAEIDRDQFLYPLLVFTYLHKKNPVFFTARDLYTMLFYFSKRQWDVLESAHLEGQIEQKHLDQVQILLEELESILHTSSVWKKEQYRFLFPVDHPSYLPTVGIRKLQEPQSGWYFYFLQPKQHIPFCVFNTGWCALLERLVMPICIIAQQGGLTQSAWNIKKKLMEHILYDPILEVKEHYSSEQLVQCLYWMLPQQGDLKNQDTVFRDQVQWCALNLVQSEVVKNEQIDTLVLQSATQLSVVRSSMILLQALCFTFPKALHYYNYMGASVGYYVHEHLRRLEYHKNSLHKTEQLFETLCHLGMSPLDIVLRPNPMDVAHTPKIQALIERSLIEKNLTTPTHQSVSSATAVPGASEGPIEQQQKAPPSEQSASEQSGKSSATSGRWL